MSIQKAINNNPINNDGDSFYSNYPKTDKSRITEFGNIDPESYKNIQYNLQSNETKTRSNEAKNLRRTLTEDAIRRSAFDFYSFSFDDGFPLSSNFEYCNSENAIVFSNAGGAYTRKTSNNVGYPFKETIEKVSTAIQNEQFGSNPNQNCGGFNCPPGKRPDPASGICVDPPYCMPPPTTPCPDDPALVNLKSTIYGYAYYAATAAEANVPNIGLKKVRCFGGHTCSRTVFLPKLELNDSSIVVASNRISLDNRGGLTPFKPFAGNLSPTNKDNRWDSFIFEVSDTSKLDNTCRLFLECKTSTNNCHNDVTMIFLVAQRADNDEYVLIFSDCVAPGTINPGIIGTVPCNEEDTPNPCLDPTPTPPPTSTPPPPTATEEPTPTPTEEPTPTPTEEPTPTPTEEPTPTPTEVPPTPSATDDGSVPTEPTPTATPEELEATATPIPL
jgi:hypothetical protein